MLFDHNVLDFQISVVRFLDVEFTDCYYRIVALQENTC